MVAAAQVGSPQLKRVANPLCDARSSPETGVNLPEFEMLSFSIETRFKLIPLSALCMALAACGGSDTSTTEGAQAESETQTESALGTVVSLVPAPIGWARVANEGQSFTLTTTTTLRYGSGTLYVQRTLAAGTYTCNNALFRRDPRPQYAKACYAMPTTAPAPAPCLG